MGEPDEVADAVAGRLHWQRDGAAAVYAPPGTAATVRVLPTVTATYRNRYIAVIVRNNRAEHSRPSGTALDAVRWAEQVRLD
jgi:hypothetical protein